MGEIATKTLASGTGWRVEDVICSAGPRSRPFEERHISTAIAAVIAGSFQYRSARGSAVMSTGSLMLSNEGQPYECGHEHSVGDRCMCFRYTPEFFERAGVEAAFPVPRIPALPELTPYMAEAQLGAHAPERVNFEELAHGLMSAALAVLKTKRQANRTPTAADERRISAVLRSIEANLGEPLPLEQLAATAKMSEFHFLRVFRQVTGIPPHKYILRARLRDAALRLKIDSSRVLDVALDAGFQDVSNFHHAFRAEFGVGPARFRGETFISRFRENEAAGSSTAA